MKLSAKLVNEGATKADIKRFAKALEKDNSDFLRESAGLACKYLAGFSRPPGTTGKARKISENLIKKDVYNAYTNNSIMARKLRSLPAADRGAYWKAWRTGDYAIANRILRQYSVDGQAGNFDGGAFLERSRTGKDRHVPYSVPEIHAPEIDTVRRFRATITKERAGICKAGWLQAAKELGKSLKSIPVWLRRHVRMDIKESKGKHVWVRNTVSYSKNLVSDSEIGKALKSAIRNTFKNWQKQVEYKARKASR